MDKRLRVKRLLHNSLSVLREARGVRYIHASEITKSDFCPRQWVLMGKYQRTFPHEKIPAALSYTFAEGWSKQHELCDRWLKESMFGEWRCLSCWKPTPPMRRPDECVHCGSYRFRYEEMNFKHPIAGTTGGIDGFVQVEGEKLLAIESKIMKSDTFKELEAPLAEHRVRTSLYLGIIKDSNDPLRHMINTDYASVIYMMRGHGYKQADGMGISPFKEFIVERDDASNAAYLSKAHAVNMSRKSAKAAQLFPHGLCDTMFCKKASKCMVVKECFGGSHPPSITWIDRKGKPQHEVNGFTIAVNGTGVEDYGNGEKK